MSRPRPTSTCISRALQRPASERIDGVGTRQVGRAAGPRRDLAPGSQWSKEVRKHELASFEVDAHGLATFGAPGSAPAGDFNPHDLPLADLAALTSLSETRSCGILFTTDLSTARGVSMTIWTSCAYSHTLRSSLRLRCPTWSMRASGSKCRRRSRARRLAQPSAGPSAAHPSLSQPFGRAS